MKFNFQSTKVVLLYKISLIFLLLLIVIKLTFLDFLTFNKYLRISILFVVIVEIIKLFKIIRNIKQKYETFIAVISSTLITIILLEIIFMFVPKSHGVGYTLSAKIWFNKYWNPINSFGYRDHEPIKNSNAILFVGDSFTAGHGLKNVNERFSNIISKKLSETTSDIICYNLGVNGSDTKTQYENTMNFINENKIKTRKIILQYYGNDIERIAHSKGIRFKGFEPYNFTNSMSENLVKGSFLLNYIYWMLPQNSENNYIDFLEKAYNNSDVFNDHINDLQKFIEYSKNHNIELIVVIFPFLNDIEFSDELYINRIVKILNDKNIKTLNVSNLIEGLEVKDRIVNFNDAHPSPYVNKLVAEKILEEL